jgi:hypothetical protein
MKVMPEHSAGRLTDTSHGGSVWSFGGFLWPLPGLIRRLLQLENLNHDG